MKGNTGTWLTTWAYLDCAIIFLTLTITRTIVRKEIATIPIYTITGQGHKYKYLRKFSL